MIQAQLVSPRPPKSQTVPAAPLHRVPEIAVFIGAFLLTAAISAFYLTSSAAGPGFALKGFPLDDAWIHLVYGRSIAHGQPFQYNPGQYETGSTSPLWALVLAPGLALGLPPVAVAKFLGILLLAAGAWVGFRAASRLGTGGAGWGFLFGFPLIPYFSFSAVSGTEVPLFVFLLLLAMDLFCSERLGWAGLTAGLAILARPEGYLLLPLFAAAIAVRAVVKSAEEGAAARQRLLDAWRFFSPAAGRLFLPAVAGAIPWVLFCLWVSGRPFPSTFYVKAAWLGFFNPEQVRKIVGLLAAQPFLGSSFEAAGFAVAGGVLGVGLWLAGLRRIGRSSREGMVLFGFFPLLFLYVLSWQLPLGEIAAPDVPGSVTNFYYARYLLPALAPAFLVWSAGLVEVGRIIAGKIRPGTKNPRSSFLLVVLAALVALPAASAFHQHGILGRTYSWNCENIETMQVAAGRWIVANLPQSASIGVTDAGAVRFFGERRTVDLVGLNSHRLLPLLQALRQAPKNSPEEAHLREEFWREQPLDHVAILQGMHAALFRQKHGRVLRTFSLQRNTICGRSDLIVATLDPASASKENLRSDGQPH